MYPAAFDYVRAESLGHALAVLAEHGSDARALAGGQSLLPILKLRLLSPSVIVDISRLDGLEYVREEEGRLCIGGLTRHVDLAERAWPREFAILGDTAGTIGDVQVRNMGTLAGALAHADPSGNWGPALQALDADVAVASKAGVRTVAVRDLFAGPYETVLEPGELITEVSLPVPSPGAAGAYLKLAKRAGDFAVASVAVQVTCTAQGICEEASIAVGGVGDAPARATEAEAFLHGRLLEDAALAEAGALAARGAGAGADVRASAEYREAMVRELLSRAVRTAMRRAAGEAVSAGYV